MRFARTCRCGSSALRGERNDMDDALQAVLIVYWSGIITGWVVLLAVHYGVKWRQRRRYSDAFWEVVRTSGKR